MDQELAAIKDGEIETAIPTAWRETIVGVVQALLARGAGMGIPADVNPVPSDLCHSIKANINSYGETIVPLPAESWSTSVCRWQGAYWEALIDLFTAESGRSDLVLSLNVIEDDDSVSGYRYRVDGVYVP